jgi:hypothetical protein
MVLGRSFVNLERMDDAFKRIMITVVAVNYRNTIKVE